MITLSIGLKSILDAVASPTKRNFYPDDDHHRNSLRDHLAGPILPLG